MKKQTAIVSRWLLAVGLGVGVMSAFNVAPARAGTWSVETMDDIPYNSPDREAEGLKRYQGETKSSSEGFPGSWGGPHYDNPYSESPSPYPPSTSELSTYDYRLGNGRTGVLWRDYVSAEPEGGEGKASLNGTIKMVLRYDPDRDWNYQIDPNDKPKNPIYIKVKVSPYISAGDGDGYGSQTPNYAKEHVEFSASPMGDVVGDLYSVSETKSYGTKFKQGDHTFYLKFDPKGQGTPDAQGSIRYLIPLVNITKAEAILDGDRKTDRSADHPDYRYEWNKGRVTAEVNVEGELAYFALKSDLEPSFSKETDASKLPMLKVTDANGNVSSVIDTNKVRWSDPSGNGPFSVQVEPGSNRAESAARRSSPAEPEGWYGDVTFQADQQTLNYPGFTWKVPEGAVNSVVSNHWPYTSSSLIITGYGAFAAGGIALGGDKAGKGMKESSMAKVTVKDDVVSLDESYTVNWHKPNDNWHLYLTETMTPHEEPLNVTKVNVSSSFSFYNLGNQEPDVPSVSEFDWGMLASNGGTLLGAGEAAWLVAGGAAVSPPVGATLMLASAGLSIAGNLADSGQPERKTYSVPNVASYSAYKQAVADAKAGITYPDGTVKFAPEKNIADAEASFKAQMFTDNEDSTDDDNFARKSVLVSGKAFFDRERKTYDCDAWDRQGYVGRDRGRITAWASPYYRVTFSVTNQPGDPGVTPTPGGGG